MEEDCTETYTTGRWPLSARRSVTEHDFPGWLAGVLARAAAARGSSYALVAGRPGSWEADLVMRLVCGTVGWDDECLPGCEPLISSADLRTAHPGTGPAPPG